MECGICSVRSSVGYCEECQTLLCEECGISCKKCGKRICPDHVQTTSHGRQLCGACMTERNARRSAAHKAHQEKAAAKEHGEIPPGEEEEEEFDEILTASVRQPPPPWKLSLYTGITGLVVMIVLLVAPGLRSVELGGMGVVRTPWVVMIIPAIAVFWSLVGFVREELADLRVRSLYGMGIAIVCCILGVVAVLTDPAIAAEEEALKLQQQRQTMSPEEMQNWRENMLQPHRRRDPDAERPEQPEQ